MTSNSPHDVFTSKSHPNPVSRPQSQAWGLTQPLQQSSRRGLTPISTSFNTTSARPGSSSQNIRNPWSPSAARSSSISSSSSPFSPPPVALQQPQPTPLQQPSRSRTAASSANPPLTSSLAQAAGIGGGGSGGRLARGSPSLSQANFNSPVAGSTPASQSAAQSGQVSKIVIAQLFLLISTIKEDKDKVKWDIQADQIRKLVYSNGMEVFHKYIRRLILNNAPHIWSSGRTYTESTGNYGLLVLEMQKITQDPRQAPKIAESVEFGEGEIFKDFDLSTFMDHFKLNAPAKIALASAFRKSSKLDLRTKGDAILSNNLQNFVNFLAKPASSENVDRNEDFSTEFLTAIIDRLAQDPPRNWSSDIQQHLSHALQQRYIGAGLLVPVEVSSSMLLFDLLNTQNPLVRLIHRSGAKATETLEACKNMLELAELRDISYQQVASSLLFMAIARSEPPYDPNIFISALREHRGGQRLDWQDVVHDFDRDNVKITKLQFRAIFGALMPVARDYENFDIQFLWGGDWHHAEPQLAFASAFLSLSEDELDASQIPKLRKAFTLEDFRDASEAVKTYAEVAVRHPFVSLEATKALFNMVFRSSDTYSRAQSLGVIDHVINPNTDLFVASISAVSKPWGALQDQAMKQLVAAVLGKVTDGHEFASHLLWKRDKSWLAARLFQVYEQDPLQLDQIFNRAQEHGWLTELIAYNNEMSLDLATVAHGRSLFDIENWLEQIAQAMPGPRLLGALSHFLRNKAEDDVSTRGLNAGLAPSTMRLTIKTVYAILTFLGKAGLAEDEMLQLHRTCIQAYPRLINYGGEYDSIIDANGLDGNGMSPAIDAKMQEHYKHMYSGENQVRQIIEILQEYKSSQDPADQDLFASMIFGLFDEYNCFGEYPLDALATTAVLFGSIINFDLLSRIALQAGLAMVLEAVRDFPPHESMYKFGLQALLHFQDRLVEWKLFSERLLNVPGLRGTPIYPTIEKVVTNQQDLPNGTIQDEDVRPHVEHPDHEHADLKVDDILTLESKMPDFTCLSADPPLRPEVYEDPDDEVQEIVLFTLNNVSERNIDVKINDIKTNLRFEHHQWFANYLVENRVKPQPNFRQLYIDLLNKLDNKLLWAEVLRETYASAVRMLNVDTSSAPSNHLSHLRNLGAWLGSMTLARNQPIKHRNISFRELLIEAHDTQRLPAVITFICKVLVMANQSLVFKPPCAWTTEVVEILVEIYNFVTLKTNPKFEIEVLCRELGLDHKTIEPSNAIRSKPPLEEEISPTPNTDGLEGFNDLPLMNFRGTRPPNECFSPTTMLPELSELSSILKHNYPMPSASTVVQNRLRQTLAAAAERAVTEIIAPVVERSVTIAAISASQLIAKDFALEPDASRYQDSAYTAVRALAGSLALVTCKEPLRASMTHNIRMISREPPELALPEGTILMFVNDNLEAVCDIVQKAAETASIGEIDSQIDDAVRLRKGQNFIEPQVNRWAFYMPEPYRPAPGGLNRDQMAIYEDFSRSARGAMTHFNHTSQDSGRQLPDVLREQFPSISNLATPAEAPQMHLQLQHQPDSLLSGPSHGPATQRLANGFSDGRSLPDRISNIASELYFAASEAADEDPTRDVSESKSVREASTRFRSLMAALPAQNWNQAIGAVQEIMQFLFHLPQRPIVVEFLARTLREFCEYSDSIARLIHSWFTSLDEERTFNSIVAIAALKSELMDIRRLDMVVAKAIEERKMDALAFLSDLVDNLLLNEPPSAWRADLANALSALAQWLSEEPELSPAREIRKKLQDSVMGVSSPPEEELVANEAQNKYIFDEWVRLQRNDDSGPSILSFIHQLHDRRIINTEETSATFFRTCVYASVAAFDKEDAKINPSVDEAYVKIDALAKLIVVAVAHQGKVNGVTRADKVGFFESILSLLVITLAHHYYKSADRFSQRAFFRLFSSVLCELQSMQSLLHEHQRAITLAFGRVLLLLQPQTFPGFAFGWTSLLSHRLLIPGLLKSHAEEGWQLYCQLLGKQMTYIGELMKPLEIPVASKELYRGTVKLLLVLHHDFPEFLAENHFQMLNQIPTHCIQLRSLVISASPSSFQELPDPFTDGLKVDRLEDNRRPPVIRGNVAKVLRDAKIMDAMEELLTGTGQDSININYIVHAISDRSRAGTGVDHIPIPVDTTLLNAIVLYTVIDAEANSRPRGLSFVANSPHARTLENLAGTFGIEARYYFINAIVDELRFPNSHTHYFSYVIFHLFRVGQTDQMALNIQQQITKVLLERLAVHRPHPWGLMVTLIELLKNRTYHFWDLPFVKAAPDLERVFGSLFQQMGNPRPMS